jgi:hypothetical protein
MKDLSPAGPRQKLDPISGGKERKKESLPQKIFLGDYDCFLTFWNQRPNRNCHRWQDGGKETILSLSQKRCYGGGGGRGEMTQTMYAHMNK